MIAAVRVSMGLSELAIVAGVAACLGLVLGVAIGLAVCWKGGGRP